MAERPRPGRGSGVPDHGDRRAWFDRPAPGRERPLRDAADRTRQQWTSGAASQPVRPLVEVEHLTKIYEPSPSWMKLLLKSSITEPVTAVADLSLQVWPGQVFAVVGPNGAGKSTLFRVLTGLITPTSGRVALAGIDVVGDARTARRHIGFMPAEDRSLNLRHTCWQNLAFHGRLQGIPTGKLRPRIDEVLDIVGLGHVPDRTGHALSSGMRARLQLARALLHEPDILILDEPTGTIDPVGAHDLLQLVQRLADERQLAVLLSSHRLEEIDALEDNVLFINKGQVVHTGSMDSLREVMEQPILRLRFDTEASAGAALDHLIALRDLPVTIEGTEVHVGGNPSPGVVLPRLGPHLARLEAVDRSRMPLQELISRLMRGDAPRAAAPAPRRPAAARPAASAPIWPGPPAPPAAPTPPTRWDATPPPGPAAPTPWNATPAPRPAAPSRRDATPPPVPAAQRPGAGQPWRGASWRPPSAPSGPAQGGPANGASRRPGPVESAERIGWLPSDGTWPPPPPGARGPAANGSGAGNGRPAPDGNGEAPRAPAGPGPSGDRGRGSYGPSGDDLSPDRYGTPDGADRTEHERVGAWYGPADEGRRGAQPHSGDDDDAGDHDPADGHTPGARGYGATTGHGTNGDRSGRR